MVAENKVNAYWVHSFPKPLQQTITQLFVSLLLGRPFFCFVCLDSTLIDSHSILFILGTYEFVTLKILDYLSNLFLIILSSARGKITSSATFDFSSFLNWRFAVMSREGKL